MLIVILSATAAVLHLRSEVEQQATAVTRNLANALNQSIGSAIANLDIALQASADEILRQQASGRVEASSVTRYLTAQRGRLPMVAAIRATNADGDVIYGSGAGQLASLADRDFFVRLRGDPTATLVGGKPVYGPVIKAWLWPFARRIPMQDGSFGGVVYGAIPLQDLERVFADVGLGPGSSISLRGADLGMIARHPPASTINVELGDTSRLAPAFLAALKNNPWEGSYVSGDASIDGVDRFQSYRRNAGHQFVINVGFSRDTVMARWRRDATVIGGVALACVLGIVAFARSLDGARRRRERDFIALEASGNARAASEARYRDLVNATEGIVWEAEADPVRFTFVSPQAERLLGYSPEAWLSSGFWEEHVHPDDRQRALDLRTARVRDGESYLAEYRFLARDGRVAWLEDTVAVVVEDGRAKWLRGIMLDVTDHKQAQIALLESQARLGLAQRTSHSGIWDWNLSTGRLTWTPELFQLFGLDPTRQEASFDAWRSIVHAEDVAAAEAQIADAIRDRKPLVNEYRIRRPSGEERWIGALGEPVYDGLGHPLRMTGICIDITERKAGEFELDRYRHHLEEQVAEQTQALQDANADLMRAKTAAEAANVAKSAFLANVSHELRTPLNAITGMAYLLRGTGLTPEQQQRLDRIDRASAHLLSLVNVILELTQIEANKLEVQVAPVDLDQIANRVASLLAESARAKGLELWVDVAPCPGSLAGSPTHLQQALMNFVINAIEFTEKGSVGIRVRPVEETVAGALIRFEVVDTGPGLEPATARRLFSVFEQADNSPTRRHGGLGIGLYLTKRLAQTMGGDAGVTSLPGSGSTFWFTARLPKAAHADAA